MRTQVAIIGAGPAGMCLALLLSEAGVDVAVVERRARDHVISRGRAGLLDQVTVGLLARLGADRRLRSGGLVHAGVALQFGEDRLRVDLKALTGGEVVIYSQRDVMGDLLEIAEARGVRVVFDALDAQPEEVGGDRPAVTWRGDGVGCRLDCDFIAGCDGSQGVSRASVPQPASFERAYDCAWVGILADAPSVHAELIYASHDRGFALASMRSRSRGRYYLQCGSQDRAEDWPDDRFWAELAARLGEEAAAGLVRGPVLEKSITAVRACVIEPMRHGRLFLVGDAAHITPPTGARGLNLAVSDAALLSRSLIAYYREGSAEDLDTYSARALDRVWAAMRLSTWMTELTHVLPGTDPLEQRLRRAEFDHLRHSTAAQAALAQMYVGAPLDEGAAPVASAATRADEADLHDIPGTTVFTGAQARKGYHLNQFCLSLMKPENRTRFRADERAYVDAWAMSEAQKRAILARDFNAAITEGANIYFLAKLFAADGQSFQQAAGAMTGLSAEDYARMMLSGGRSPQGARSIRGGH